MVSGHNMPHPLTIYHLLQSLSSKMQNPSFLIPVTLDAGAAVHQSAGLSRYAEQLAAHLLRNHADQVDLSFFYNAHSGHQLPASLRAAKVRTVQLGQPAWRLSVLATQLLRLPFYERKIFPLPPYTPTPPHLYHAAEHLLPYLHSPTVLTVHDLVFERHPEHHTRKNRLFLQVGMRLFVRAAHTIIAVSQQTKRDLIEFYHTPAAKIRVIYEGIDTEFGPVTPDEVQRIHRHYSPDASNEAVRPYLLMVGTLNPRKNHAAAMRALVRLKAQGFPHRLLIVGGEGWLFGPVQKVVDELNLGGDVTFTGHVAAADLPALYAGADCLLLPSLYEGFGFPVLEAMACGAPVVCSNVSSLPEVAGDAALTVAPTDDEALAAAIRRVLVEPGLADTLRARGFVQAAQFRWDRCAQETVAVYQETVEKYRG